MFSKFDPQHYEACGFNPQFIRHYPCPVNGCKHTGRTPAAISQHIRSASEACKLPYAQEHATYLGKLFQFYRIVLRTNDEPDYLLDSYQGPSAAHKNKHQKTEQPLISHQKRSKKLDEPAAKRSKTAGSDRDYPIDLLKGFTETLGAASQKQLAAAKEVYDIRSQTKDKMHKQTVAHQEQMHESQRTNAKQEARRREQVHELQLANAKQEAEKKVLQAQLAAAELYKTTVLPLVTRLAAQGDAEVLLMAEHAQTQHAQTQHAPTQPHQPVQFTA